MSTEQLKFSNPMMDNEDDADEEAEAGSSKIDNPRAGRPESSAKSDHQTQMDKYFAEEDQMEEMDEVVSALILFYLFEDATCTS